MANNIVRQSTSAFALGSRRTEEADNDPPHGHDTWPTGIQAILEESADGLGGAEVVWFARGSIRCQACDNALPLVSVSCSAWKGEVCDIDVQ